MKEIQLGAELPVFALKNQSGALQNSKDFLGKPLVIYFYPKNNTPICTKQACAFRDSYEVFTDMDVQVVGISHDSVNSHQKFAEKHRLPFTLLSDENNEVHDLFGVPKSLFGLAEGRITYVFDATGKLVHKYQSFFQSKGHVDEALAILKKNA